MENRSLNIFILEDNIERIKWFEQIFSDCNIVSTFNIDIACDELRTKDFDMVFLDRDLGYLGGKSGEDVAWVMKEEKLVPNACIIVHTVNPGGQRNMKKYLESYHKNVNMIDFTSLIKMKRSDFKLLDS